jgi:hypothetical protein
MRQSRLFKHFRRRGQSGQALVILAIGFIALLGFVGIVTDVSLLFVRYSTLRRAVDAAAVAAAGQMRRIADSNTADAIAQDEADNVAQLNLAARQFIELYGLNPNDVWVETCRAQRVARDSNGNPLASDGTPLLSKPPENLELRRYRELCTDDELKLVRVTAQLNSPTIFLQILGQRSVILTESAISQTAVIDVVLIFDVSESMMTDTRYTDWERVPEEVNGNLTGNLIGLGQRSVPPVQPALVWDDTMWNNSQSTIYNNFLSLDGTPFTPATLVSPPAGDSRPTPTTQSLPRAECQWRAWPIASGAPRSVPQWLKDEYIASYPGGQGAIEAHFGQPMTSARWAGFMPTFDYYGCCNDPNGNMRFGDLVCQPFRQARDAAEQFLQRLDFKRGDRVAIVTFDRGATLIDPDGNGIQTPMIEVERNLDSNNNGTIGDVANDRKGALETLRDVVGVRAETNFYRDTNANGLWDSLVNLGGAVDYTAQNATALRNLYDYPLRGSCPFDMAYLNDLYTPYDQLPNGATVPVPGTYHLFTGYSGSTPSFPSVITVPAWYGVPDPYARIARSYEYRASCAGTNIGGGLARASSALFREGRREGAVWIMVMLSDGAAGASDPVSRNGTNVGTAVQPFLRIGSSPYVSPQAGADYGLAAGAGLSGYGTFGVCPYGVSGDTELADPNEVTFPQCSDEQPESRNFCPQGGSTRATQPNTIAMDASSECVNYYDVDDYARDWADWVGLANLSIYSESGNTRTGQEQLPTIFSIGFGLSYPRLSYTDYSTSGFPTVTCNADDWGCRRRANTEDYLGEELLRYIADVGDNFRIDDDYWQNQPRMQDRLPAASRVPAGTPANSALWGPRGACQMPYGGGNRGDYAPLTPVTDCGNYFAAPDGEKLEQVFNEIASRMFTRLSQ